MQWRAPPAAGGAHLLDWPVQGVVAAVGLDRALGEVAAGGVVRPEAAHVEGPQVVLGLAVEDPLRYGVAGAAARRDARGEAAGDEEVVEPGRRPHDRLAVGRDRDRAVDD